MCYSMSSAWEFLVTTQFLDLAILCMRCCCCCWGVGHTDPRYAIFSNFTPFAALTERDRESGKEGEWEQRAQWPRAVTASAAASTVAAAAVLPPFLLLLRFILRYLVFGLNDFGQRVRKKNKKKIKSVTADSGRERKRWRGRESETLNPPKCRQLMDAKFSWSRRE